MRPQTIRTLFTRRRTRALLSAVGAIALLVGMAVPAFANLAGSNFESGDGNLAVDTAGNVDWNSFSPATWTGTAPYQTATKTLANGWTFAGFSDAQKSNTDTGFKGGTKQDDNCAGVIGSSAPNKDDLKRIYLASNLISGRVFLTLAWVRIPQQTVSSSAHVGFEFNQGATPCPVGSDGLVQRTAGDMLIVYDFAGGANTPTITIRRWVLSGACEISSDSAPCWGPASTDLIAAGTAEAKVDFTTFPVQDTVAPTTESLGQSEFGEAGIDLTGAGVFSPNQCTSFGQAEGVSRSSGNSGQAAMEDLVGPGKFTIANCGNIIIRKVTVPSPDPTNTSFSYSTTGGLNPASFQLTNGGSKDYGGLVQTGSYSVTEADPGPNFALTGLDCSASSTTHGSTASTDTSTRTVTISLKPLDTIDCTYTNTLHQGAIKITKTSVKAPNPGVDGAQFSISSNGSPIASSPFTTANGGTICVDHLPFGSYSVQETAAPSGYKIDDTSVQTVTVNTNSTCGDGNEVKLSFTDTPLSQITVSFHSKVSGATSATIQCTGDATAQNLPDGTPRTLDDLVPGTYTCTVVIDP
jgi:Prealbumin-like fold domain